MFAAMLFTISIVALAQFGLYYWRAVLSGVASQPVSDRVLRAAHVENGRVTSQDFETLAGLHDLTPDLYPNRGGLGLVRLYYRVIEGVDALAGSRVPAIAAWSNRERGMCARYAAGRISRSHGDNQRQIAFVQASLLYGIPQAQGDGPCRRVSVPVDVHHDL